MAFIEWEVPYPRTGRYNMCDNEISLNYVRGKNYYLTFNRYISKEVLDKHIKYCMIGLDDETGELRIVLNKHKGLEVHITGTKYHNVIISSKVWIEKLYSYLGLSVENKRCVLKVSENLSDVEDELIYEIIK